MALTINQQPGNVSFAGNSILVKASTSLSGKTFMRIVAEVEATAESAAGSHLVTESYEYNVSGTEQAVFNVAETVKAAISQYSRQYVDADGATVDLCRCRFSVTLKEIYLDKMIEVTGATTKIGPFTAVLGALSDYELTLLPNQDIETYIGTGMVLSRKPDGEVIYGGHPLYIPVVTSADAAVQLKVSRLDVHGGGTVKTGNVSTSSYIPNVVELSTDVLADGMYDVAVTPISHAYLTRKYFQTSPPDRHCSFLFVNGFGVLESITALTGRSYGYQVSQEHYTELGDIGQPLSDSINVGGPSRSEIKMTSGFVSYEWADWWASEFLPSRKIWMLFGTRYLPVSVVADGNVVLNDPSRPGLCEVKFTVRCAFRGSTVNIVR